MGRRKSFVPLPRLYAPPPPVAKPAKPLEYLLVDLLGEEGIGDSEIEAIRVVLLFASAQRKKEAAASEESEIAALVHDLERVMTRENQYLNALMEISNTEGAASEIAFAALYPDSSLVRLRELAADADTGNGTSLAGMSKDQRREALSGAQVDTHSESEDAQQASCASMGSAVANGDAPTPKPGDQ